LACGTFFFCGGWFGAAFMVAEIQSKVPMYTKDAPSRRRRAF
jgi:hypothetical protein